MSVAITSMAVVLSEEKRRRVAAMIQGDDQAHTDRMELRQRQRRRHRASEQPQYDLQQRDTVISKSRRNSQLAPSVDDGTRNSPEPFDDEPGTPMPPALRLGNGVWDYVLLPLVAESIGFLGGLVVIYLAQVGRVYTAVALLVALFTLRVKSTAFSAAFAPLTENSKVHLLKSLDRETLHDLLRDDLPRWVKFPDVEKCDWLNQTVETLWPYVKAAVARSVKEALTPALEAVKPKIMMTELGFRGLDLGTAAPMINGIKSQKHLEEQVVIDIDLLFATQDTDIVFSFGNPGSSMSLTIELSDFLLRGTLRVVMKPLFPRWPTFGAVFVSFTEKPTVDFHLKTLGVNWMGLPALSSIFHNAIRSAIESKVVWPNKIVVPMVQDLSKLEMESLSGNKPLGMLVVKNLRLSGVVPSNPLSRLMGMQRFQVQLSIDNEKITSEMIQGKDANNFEDRVYHLLALDPKTQALSLSLDCKDTLCQFKLIDSKWIHLDHLVPHVDSKEFIAFGRDGAGQGEFELCWYPFSGMSQVTRRLSSEAPLPEEIACMGGLFIKLVKCEKLAPMDYNGSSDPYVIFRVGSRVKQSSIKATTLNPIWDPPEHFELVAANHRHDILSVTVMDYDYLTADDQIGQVEIPLAQVQRNGHMTKSWLLDNNSGSITLELEWKGFV
ncbi:Extended synaptotagmin, partial [Globisporangium splendens]